MKTLAFALLAVVFFIAGCAGRPGDTYDVVVDTSAGLTLADDIVMAAGMWESIVPVHLAVSLSDHCEAAGGRICVHAASHDFLLNTLHAPKDDWAKTLPLHGPTGREDGADVYVDVASIWPSRLHVLVAHELGHAMGLSHTGEGTVMCPMNWCMANGPTAADAQQWHDVRR